MGSSSLVLSFADFWRAIKHSWWLLVVISAIGGVCTFAYFLTRPIYYTAEALFKGSEHPAETGLNRTLGKLLSTTPENYNPQDDPATFLVSYPVLESVVRTLDLQAKVSVKEHFSFLRRIPQTWRAEKIRSYLRGHRPDAHTLTKRDLVPERVYYPEHSLPIRCHTVDYPLAHLTKLTISVEGENNFVVNNGKNAIGEGEFGVPFTWEGGSFTLEAVSASIKDNVTLTLIPLVQATQGLQKCLDVKADKTNRSLIHIHLTHSDPRLATRVVNTTMAEFCHYLAREAERKINHQLAYLEKRHEEAFATLNKNLIEHQEHLQNHMTAARSLSPDKEVEGLIAELAKKQQEKKVVRTKIEKLEKKFSNEQVEQAETKNLTVSSASALIKKNEESMSQLALRKQEYALLLDALANPTSDPEELSGTLQDEGLFQKLRTLHRNLADEKNWTTKEREKLREQIETERKILHDHISRLHRGTVVQESVLSSQNESLNCALLPLLRKKESALEEKIEELEEKMAFFPENWLSQKKIAINTELYKEMLESITNMIEAKNITYHLDYSSASPFMEARLVLLPDSPHLLSGFFAGFGGVLFLSICIIAVCEAWRGPTASLVNLKSAGFTAYANDEKVLWNLARHISGEVLVAAKRASIFAASLASYMKKRDTTVEVRELRTQPNSLELAERWEEMEHLVYLVTDERLRDLGSLPPSTLIVVLENTRPQLSLADIEQLLRKRIPSSQTSSEPASPS